MVEESTPSTESSGKAASVMIVINGGNNQILPSATHASQVFYNGKPGEPGTPDVPVGQCVEEPPVPDIQVAPPAPPQCHLSRYITDAEVLSYYLERCRECHKCKALAKVVIEMVNDPAVRVDREVMVQKDFLEGLLSLAPGVSNCLNDLRYHVNALWAKSKLHR